MSKTPRPIPFGIMLQGPGSHMHAWKHPSNPADASVKLGNRQQGSVEVIEGLKPGESVIVWLGLNMIV